MLVNNDVVCEPQFLERLCAPLEVDGVGMAAGVLLQGDAPGLVDSAGIELDTTLRSWDLAWNRPVAALDGLAEPVAPVRRRSRLPARRLPPARRLRRAAVRLLGGRRPRAALPRGRLALRPRAGRAGAAPHGATLGAASSAQRQLEAFGRGYVLAKYRVAARRPLTRLKIAALDIPVLLVHLVVRRDAEPIRSRLRGRRAGLAAGPLRAPLELATVGFTTALRRQADLLRLRFTGRLPAHFGEHGPAPTTDTPGTPSSDRA